MQRYIGYFLWYDVFVGDGLRSDGADDLPLSTSVCSILPIARLLRAGLRHALAATFQEKRELRYLESIKVRRGGAGCQ